MTITEAFTTFKSDLELPDAKQRQASDSQQEVRSKLSTHLYIPDSFLTGSYARHTKIHPLNDIDVFLVRNDSPVGLTTDGSGTGAAQALQQVATAVRSAYPSAKITTQSRSVNAEIPGLQFGFDLIPAWKRSGGGFWIPDGDHGFWLPTDPQRHADLMTAANDATSGTLKPLIKMTKHWSRQNHDLLRSFHIELICKHIITTRQTSWSVGMATVLAYLSDHVGKPLVDPIFGASRVDKELSAAEHAQLTLRVTSDAGRAIEALKLENSGQHVTAAAKWKEIFLQGFPG